MDQGVHHSMALGTETTQTPADTGGGDGFDEQLHLQEGGNEQSGQPNDIEQGGNEFIDQYASSNEQELNERNPLISFDEYDCDTPLLTHQSGPSPRKTAPQPQPSTTQQQPVEAQEIVPTPETTKKLWTILWEVLKIMWSSGKGNPTIWTLCAFILVVFGVFSIFVYQTENFIQSATNVEITNIEIDHISEKGLTAWVSVSLDWEYKNVNWFLTGLFYPAMSYLGKVTIDNTEPVSVFINFPQSADEHFYNPTKGQFVLPMDIDLSPSAIGQSMTVPIELEINPYDAIEVYNNLLTVKDVLKEPKIQVSTVLQSKFSVKSERMNYGSFAATIRKEVILEASNITVPNYTVDNISFTPAENAIMGDVEITFDKPPVRIRSTIGEIEWDVYIPGCETNLLYIATITSSKVHFGGLVPVDVDASVTIPKLSKKLQKFCTDGFSPVNRFTKKALEDEATVFLQARGLSEINDKLPKWLFAFLSNSLHPVTISGKNVIGELPVSDVSYRLVNANILVTNDADVLPQLYSDAGVTLSLPVSNENNQFFNLSKIYGDVCFLYDDEIVMKVYLHSWQDIQTFDNTFAIHIRRSNLDIIDEDLVAELALKYLAGETFDILSKGMFDLDVTTPITDSVFQRIEQHAVISVEGQTGMIDQLDMNIEGLSYISTSTDSQLRFFVDMEVINPLNVGGGFQFLNLLLDYNGTEIGNIELTEAIIESNWTTRIRPIVRFKAEDEDSREAINLVVSELISGKEPVIVVKGHDQTCKVPAISKVLSNIALPFKAPAIGGSDPDHPGFVVSATFHLLKSDVEITAYNPIDNQDVILNINHARAVYKDIDVAFIDKAPLIRLPPGVSTTQRIPVRIAPGAAGDLLRRALNSNVTIHTVANFDVVIGQFLMNLDYEGQAADAIIKL